MCSVSVGTAETITMVIHLQNFDGRQVINLAQKYGPGMKNKEVWLPRDKLFTQPILYTRLIHMMVTTFKSNVRVGCAHFAMCMFHSQLIDFDLQDTFCEVSPKACFLLSLLGLKYMYLTLGRRSICKCIRKSNWYTKTVYTFLYILCCTFKNIVNLKLKFEIMKRKIWTFIWD